MNLWSNDNCSMMEAFMVSADLSGYPSWAAPSPTPPTPTPAAAVLSPASASYFNQETLQQCLQTLIETAKEAWTYAIFWQSSVDVATGDSLLGWGDGYYKGGFEEDKRKGKSSSASSAADQEHRKRVLRELNSLISGGPSPDEAVEEEVTDTEWFFLVSMTQSFVNGDGLPGQALFSGQPSWLAGGGMLAVAPCERARQEQQLWTDLAQIYAKLGLWWDSNVCLERAKSVKYFSPKCWHEAAPLHLQRLVAFSCVESIFFWKFLCHILAKIEGSYAWLDILE